MKKIIILFTLILFIISCGDKVREEIIERYDNGSKKLLVKYKGSDKTIVERTTYSENGDTLLFEKPLDKIKMEKVYYSNGQIKEIINYKNEKMDGKYVLYYLSGNLYMKGKYKDGIRAEQWFQYFENGQPWTISPIYHEGKRNGKYIEYYENGDVLAEASFKDDKKNGKLIHYSETGEITLEGNFIMGDGKLIGYRNGKIISETNILNGEIVDTKRY